MQRIKQAIVAVVFIGVFVVITLFLLRNKDIDEPVETAPPIAPLEIRLEKLIETGEQDYDFIASIHNPNKDFGASLVQYAVILSDRDGAVLLEKRGNTYLLPFETKYIVESPLRTERPAVTAQLQLLGGKWDFVKDFLNRGPLFSTKFKNLDLLSDSRFKTRVSGEVANNSDFDFRFVDIIVVLFNLENVPIAANRTNLQDFLHKTDRFFEVFWQDSFDKEKTKIDIRIYTDVYKNLNFIRRYGEIERFQKFF